MEAVYLIYSTSKTFIRRCVDGVRDFAAPMRERVSDPKTQKRLILLIVCLALLLDNMLYMVIVPIIDDYFKPPKQDTDITGLTNQTTVSYPQMTGPQYTTILGNISSNPGSGQTLQITPAIDFYLGTPKSPIEEVTKKHKLEPLRPKENRDGMMGLLFASKAIVQLCVNPLTGAFIDRIGYVTPLTMGLVVMFLSTTLFACAETYGLLFLARSLQGLGSALADTASFGLIADRFQDEAERSKALGIALAFISFGSLVAPPFGGVLYEFAGRQVPFIILAFVCLIDAMLLLLVKLPSEDEERAKEGNMPVGTPIYKLLMDPYILVIAGSLTIANFPLAFLEPTIAKWMQNKMGADPWQIGLVWLPPFIPHVLGVILTVWLSVKYFRFQWLYGAIGLVVIGVSTTIIPICNTYWVLILPLSLMCFGIALIDTALLPTLAFLVDVRHTSVYGSVYAIADISYSLAYALGPVLAGQAVRTLGYLNMNIIIGLVNMFFAPTLLVLRQVYDWKVDKGERAMLLPDIPESGFAETYHVQRPKHRTPLSSVGDGMSENDRGDSSSSVTGNGSSTPTSEGGSTPTSPMENGHVLDAIPKYPGRRVRTGTDTAGKSRLATTKDSIMIKPRPRPRPRQSAPMETSFTSTGLNWDELAGSSKDSEEKISLSSLTNGQSKNEYRNASTFLKTHEDGFEVRNPLFDDSKKYYPNEGE